MLLPSVRRIALSDVDENVLRQMVDHGESLYVRRKPLIMRCSSP